MVTKSLCTNVWPLVWKRGKRDIKECFIEELLKANEIRISVAYFSKESLNTLDELIDLWNIKRVCLILGMYNEENFLEESYELALKINKKWQRSGKGEIRMTKKWRNHEKLYCFWKDGQIFSSITGSPNLSFLHNRRYPQYERANLIKDPEDLKESLEHINNLLLPSVTVNINQFFFAKKETRSKSLK